MSDHCDGELVTVEAFDERMDDLQRTVRALSTVEIACSAQDLRKDIGRLRSLRLGDRVSRIERLMRDISVEAEEFARINTRMTVIEEGLAQIIEHQRRPWWKKVFG